ncbi:hypothetical protein LTR84_009234 [Exophiala bonariae]|uniref:Uncharacterized protein n=1 Tax=Exophiala bonariae TaxID=1690606 RepID=A0AAV9MV74_9EURO|nr:hypothetical protein LTR84_009234 [Exophiala bonariae]
MSDRNGRDLDYGSRTFHSSSTGSNYALFSPARTTTYTTPYTTTNNSSSTAALLARARAEMDDDRGSRSRSLVGSWAFSPTRGSSDLYRERNEGVYHSNSSALSHRSTSSERRRRYHEDMEMDQFADSRLRDWLDSGTGTLRRARSFDRGRPTTTATRPYSPSLSPSRSRQRSPLLSRFRSPSRIRSPLLSPFRSRSRSDVRASAPLSTVATPTPRATMHGMTRIAGGAGARVGIAVCMTTGHIAMASYGDVPGERGWARYS